MANYAVVHKACLDGLASAWVVTHHLPYTDVVFSSYNHQWKGELKDKLKIDDTIYFIDFCPEPEDMKELVDKSISFEVIDHHDSTERKIREYDEKQGTKFMQWCNFDMNRCGATLAWEYFQKLTKRENEMPLLLTYVEISDTWSFRNEADKAVASYIHTIMPPHSHIEEFGKLTVTFDEKRAKATGKILRRRMMTEVKYTVSKACLITYDGQDILSVNASQHLSEIGHELAVKDENGLGIVYNLMPESKQVKFSVRSDGNGKANKLAAKFGGGGHPDAGGFYMKMDDFHNNFLMTAKVWKNK